MVLRGGEIARSLDVAPHQLSGSRLVERAAASREHALVADQVLDHRLGIRPVHVCRCHEAPELLGRRREPALTGERLRGADEDEREYAIGKVQRQQLRECPTRRDADDWPAGMP